MSDAFDAEPPKPVIDPIFARRTRGVALVFGAAAVTLGILVLAGYALGWGAAISVAPGLRAMSTLTAALFCLEGAAIVGLALGRGGLAEVLFALAALIAAAVLAAQLIVGADPFSRPLTQALFPKAPMFGTTSIATALSFLSLALADGLPGRRWPRLADVLSPLVLIVSALAILGYAFSVSALYASPIFHTMALHTALGLAVLSLASMLLHPERGLVSAAPIIASYSPATRLRLGLIVATPLVGWLLLVPTGARWLGPGAALVILVVATIAPLIFVVFRGARTLRVARGTQGDRSLLGSIVSSSDDAIIGKTLQGVVTSWNKGAEDMFGYSAGEMIGGSLERIFPPGLFAEEPRILAQLSRGERIQHYETTRLRKDGSAIQVSISVSPVRDEAGRIIGAAKIARNVTEQKRVQARLEEVQAELFHVSRLNDMSQMATGLAHELNQPLSAIGNYISGARTLIEKGDLARAIEGCERAAAQVVRAGEVIRRLRDFVEKAEGQKQVEALGPIIEESRALALLGTRNEGLGIDLQIAPDATSAVVDRVQIQQVIVNIIRNAAEAMASSPIRLLIVSTRRVCDDWIEMSIADTGPGLSETVEAKLFQPFTTTKATGMGVGLSLCRSIVEAHGGHIRAENNPGSGVTFRFTLPSA
jgi:two-component system sensor kinase FixL